MYIGMRLNVKKMRRDMLMFMDSASWAVDMYVILRDNCNL